MLKTEQIEQIQPVVRTIRIICVALIAGVLMMTLLLCSIVDWQNVTADFNNILVVVAVGLGLIITAKAFVVPGIIGNSMANSIEPSDKSQLSKLVSAYQTRTIIQFALLEGAAFFNVIVFFIERSVISLGVVAFLVAVMLVILPRSDSIYSWIEERMLR